MPSIKDFRVDSDIEVDGEQLTTVIDGEEQDDVDIVGYNMMYTIGSDFVVPRDWLIGRMEDLGLYIYAGGPDGERKTMAPPKVTPKRAFNRTRDRIVPELTIKNPAFDGEGKREIGERVMHFESKKATTNEWHITAESFFTADELSSPENQVEDGEWRQTTLAIFRYNKENKGINPNPKVDEDDALYDTAMLFVDAGMQMFGDMQDSHTGRDIQKMLNRYTGYWTDSIKLRDGGAVYFVPAGYDDTVRGLQTLIEEIDEDHKKRGKDCELQVHSMVDSDEERRQIERRVRKHLEKQVENAMDTAFEALADEDTVAHEIADSLEDRLEGLDSFADDYNALLSARLSAQEVLEEKQEALQGEKEAIVEEALKESEAVAAE